MAEIPNIKNLLLRTIGNYKKGFNNYPHVEDVDKINETIHGTLSDINNELNDIQKREIQVEYYEVVAGASSGNSVNVPAEATLLLNKFGSSGDTILSKVDGNNIPAWESPKDSEGITITSSITQAGLYVFSGTPVDANLAIIYTIKINQEDWSNLSLDFIIAESELTNVIPDNLVIVNDESAFQLSGGKLLIADNTRYESGNSNLNITKPFSIINVSNISSFDALFSKINYTGGGIMFTGSNTGSFTFTNALVDGNLADAVHNTSGNGDNTNNFMVLKVVTFRNFLSKGIIDGFGGLNHREVQYANCGTGLILKDILFGTFGISPVNNSVTSNSPHFVLTGQTVSFGMEGSPTLVQDGESYLQVSKNFTVLPGGSVNILGNVFTQSGTNEFLASAKTGVAIIADNGGGKVRVTSVAHKLTIEQVVELLDTTSHDGDHNVLSIIDDDTFDLDLSFVGVDSGNWTTGDSGDFRYDLSWNVDNNGTALNSTEEFTVELANPITVIIPSPNTIVEVQGITNDWLEILARRFGFEIDGSGRIRVLYPKKRTYPVSANMTIEVVSGGNKLMSAYILINSVPIGSSIFSQTSNRAVGFAPKANVPEPTIGDYFSIGVENADDSTNLIVSTAVLTTM